MSAVPRLLEHEWLQFAEALTGLPAAETPTSHAKERVCFLCGALAYRTLVMGNGSEDSGLEATAGEATERDVAVLEALEAEFSSFLDELKSQGFGDFVAAANRKLS